MSVLKNMRDLSKMEFYRNGLALRSAVMDWLLKDFATKPRQKDIQAVEHNISTEDIETIKEILDRNGVNYNKAFQRIMPEWFRDSEKVYLLEIVRDMMRNIVSANSIYVGKGCNIGDYIKRRGFQTEAIACVQALVEEIYEIQRDFPSDLNRTVKILELCDREFDLLKGWRKSENKLGKG